MRGDGVHQGSEDKVPEFEGPRRGRYRHLIDARVIFKTSNTGGCIFILSEILYGGRVEHDTHKESGGGRSVSVLDGIGGNQNISGKYLRRHFYRDDRITGGGMLQT